MSGYNYNYNEQTDPNNILHPNFSFNHMNSVNNSTIGYITQNNFIPNTNNINNYYQILTPTITTTSPALTSSMPTFSTSFANSILFPGTTTQIFDTITGPLGHHIYGIPGLVGPTGGNYTIIDSGASGHNGPNPIYNHDGNVTADTGGSNYPPMGPQYDYETPYYNGPQGATGHSGFEYSGVTGSWGGMGTEYYGDVLKIKNNNFEFDAKTYNYSRYYFLKYNNKKTNVTLKLNQNTGEPYSNAKFMRLIKELDYISNYEKDIDIASKCQTILRRDKYIKQKMDKKIKITI